MWVYAVCPPTASGAPDRITDGCLRRGYVGETAFLRKASPQTPHGKHMGVGAFGAMLRLERMFPTCGGGPSALLRFLPPAGERLGDGLSEKGTFHSSSKKPRSACGLRVSALTGLPAAFLAHCARQPPALSRAFALPPKSFLTACTSKMHFPKANACVCKAGIPTGDSRSAFGRLPRLESEIRGAAPSGK